MVKFRLCDENISFFFARRGILQYLRQTPVCFVCFQPESAFCAIDFLLCARFVILCLRRPERAIFPAFVAEERLVRAGLRDASVIEHGDPVAEAAGGQPVADVDGGAVAGNGVEVRVDLVF